MSESKSGKQEMGNVRNKVQELKYQNIIRKVKKNVEKHFPEIYFSVEFGAYIQPENYFVAYIFRTNAQLSAAQQSGLMEKINLFHEKQLRKNHYPIQGIKDCYFASQEQCDKEYNGNWYYYFK